MVRNSRCVGDGHACRAWLVAAAALLLILAQTAYSSPLWGVSLSAGGAWYDSATGGSGSGSERACARYSGCSFFQWSAPTVPGLTAASAQSRWWCWGSPLICEIEGDGYAQAAGSLWNASVSVSVQADVASAEISDTLTFYAARATSSTVTDIGVHFTVAGSDFGGWDYSLLDDLWLDEGLQLGTGSIEYAWDGYSYALTKTDTGWVSSYLRADDTASLIFDGIYEFRGPSATVPFSMWLLAETGNVGRGDLGGVDERHASVTLSLPRGVTYTSASGAAFLGSVPEPAAWMMMLLGGLGLIGMGRIRKR